ncbi:hypothetical protein K3M35_05225 [Rhodococcus sp. DMU2021]|uniref:hypothetical protein n=1 Tax=Rhodococcus sp. DMU2021 TaxID=2866997 RepID=UPI001C7D8649|nr:hypothetical protein [Rhodococcus sp. DMU2021]MBX4168068.1 hypothetical protein [Rhodococcus sp. DMU2021]
MSTAPWGLDADGHPKTAREAAHERIEKVVKDYIDIGLKIAAAGGFDDKTIHTIRHLFLAEPWLPASTAVEVLESAGLLLHASEASVEWAVHSKVHGSVERWKPCRDQEDAENWAGSIEWGRDPGDWEIRPHVVSRTVTSGPWEVEQ